MGPEDGEQELEARLPEFLFAVEHGRAGRGLVIRAPARGATQVRPVDALLNCVQSTLHDGQRYRIDHMPTPAADGSHG